MKMKFWLFCALALCSVQVAIAQNDTAVSVNNIKSDTPPEIQKSGYLVGPGDVISGKVLGEDQFNFIATIDEDGKFQVPFFDKSIMAKCRTEKQLRTDVTQLLSRYLKSPLVSVSVTARNSRPPATIYGEVRSPQQIKLERKPRLLELLAFAGGVTEKAGGAIQIFHTQPPLCEEAYEDGSGGTTAAGNAMDFPFRVYSLSTVQQGSEQANPLIYPGDIVVVKEALPVYIVGEVNAVGKIAIPEGGLTLTQALASIGGVHSNAKIKDIKIYRLKSDSAQRGEPLSVNYDAIKKGKEKDILLSPYDIVEVGKAPKTVGQFLTEIALGGVRTAAGGFGSLPQTVLR